MTYDRLKELFSGTATIKKTRITDEFTDDDYRQLYGETAIPLVIIDESCSPNPVTAIDLPKPKSGDLVVSLVTQSREEAAPDETGSGD